MPNTLGPDILELAKKLEELLQSEWLVKTAKETGFVSRLREIHPSIFLWSLALCFGVHMKLKLAEMHRSYQQASARSISWPAYYDHFNSECSLFLDRCIEHAMSQEARYSGVSLHEALRVCDIRDIRVMDSTIVRLNAKLASIFPNARSNTCPAAAKLHLQMSLASDSPSHFQIVPGKESEHNLFVPDESLQDTLVLFDLGYYCKETFKEIQRHGGYFICRLKSNIDPLLVRSLDSGPGNRIDLTNKRLRATEPFLKRKIVDALGVLGPRNMSKKRQALLEEHPEQFDLFRIVAIRDDRTGEYHSYVTNLPFERLEATWIPDLYRVRWTIEILFKELKSFRGLDTITSGKKEVIEILIKVCILTMIVSGRVRQLLEEGTASLREEPPRVSLFGEERSPESLLPGRGGLPGANKKPMGPLVYAEWFARNAILILYGILEFRGLSHSDTLLDLALGFGCILGDNNQDRRRLRDIYTASG